MTVRVAAVTARVAAVIVRVAAVIVRAAVGVPGSEAVCGDGSEDFLVREPTVTRAT